ncbi:diguanylate cyclase [Roseibium sp. TrichSKD4]|uniref:GGDEF domain-containing protein n=1 Tax=Roseibium sp. TrichSKD4 TaxID=744980 RepID=UPI0001E572E7|nr:GGDEF domain-containing protein [Roseibium sp. TrichSKD4]EFO29746.1 diguanylate cyclase [Roseibium sp. TrichSKD4]
MAEKDDYERTIGYGEFAISYIKRNKLPAHPRAYELWYTYSSGYNHELNREVNKTIKSDGQLNTEEMHRIYNKFLSSNRLESRLEELGEKVSAEVEDLVDTLQHSADTTSDYGDLLEKAGEKMKDLKDPAKIQMFVAHLVKSTRSAVESNRKLEGQLLESKNQIQTLQANLETIRHESLTDELTTLNNRKHFDGSLDRAIQNAVETETGFALLMTDIDHFKKFNDTFGHQTGDQVLRLVALSVKQNVRSNDTACRYGGEEFAIILPTCPKANACTVADKIRDAVKSKELVKRSTGQNLGRITISIGISTYQSGDTAESLISRADQALYQAKHDGRDCVRTEDDLAQSSEQVA